MYDTTNIIVDGDIIIEHNYSKTTLQCITST